MAAMSPVGPDRCCGDGQLGSNQGDTGHVSDAVKPVLVTRIGHHVCITAIETMTICVGSNPRAATTVYR